MTYEELSASGPLARSERSTDLLIELPHGATTEAHLLRARELLPQAPPSLETIFWCTTDQGAPELAQRLLELLVDPDWARQQGLDAEAASKRSVRAVRCLMPRHLLDLNRAWDHGATATAGSSSMSAVIPAALVEDRGAVALLGQLHQRYVEHLRARYDEVCAGGGRAIQLHSYAPRSVALPRGSKESRATLLRQAWTGRQRERWPLRPSAQLIASRRQGPQLLAPSTLEMLSEEFGAIRIELAVDRPYCLTPGQMLDVWAHRWPGQVFGLEVSRTLLAKRYDPLGPWEVAEAKVERVATALARAVARWLERGA